MRNELVSGTDVLGVDGYNFTLDMGGAGNHSAGFPPLYFPPGPFPFDTLTGQFLHTVFIDCINYWSPSWQRTTDGTITYHSYDTSQTLPDCNSLLAPGFGKVTNCSGATDDGHVISGDVTSGWLRYKVAGIGFPTYGDNCFHEIVGTVYRIKISDGACP